MGARMHLRDYLNQPDQSQQKLADRLRVSQGLISQWLNWLEQKDKNASRITPDWAVKIESETDGSVTCEELVGYVDWIRHCGSVTHYKVRVAA